MKYIVSGTAAATRLAVLAAVVLLGACGENPVQPAPTVTPGANVSTAASTTLLSINFETTPLGALGSPWFVSPSPSSTASTVRVVSTSTTHGRVLLLHGATTLGDYLVASRSFSSSASQISTAVDIRPTAGSSFIWTLHGAGSSIGSRRIRLQRAPGSTMLVAQTSPSGSTNCGNVANGVWSRVTLLVDARTFPHTFDVLINGVATACRRITANLSPPFNAVSVMDASNAGWGGDVRFDNILVTTP
jgi:hypothetical protein